MAVTNNLNVWPSTNSYPSSTDAASDSYFSSGFATGNSISSKTFNTILRELSLTNKAIFEALKNIAGASINATVDLSESLSDLAATVKSCLEKLSVASATQATNISGGSTGQVLYQSTANTTSKLAAGTDKQVMTYDGTNSKPKWSNQSDITAGNINGGNAGDLLYQSASGTTSKLPKGTSGQVLTQDTNAPKWTDQDDLHAGKADVAGSLVKSGNDNGKILVGEYDSDTGKTTAEYKSVDNVMSGYAKSSDLDDYALDSTVVKKVTVGGSKVADLPYLSTPPSSNNNTGTLRIVILDSANYAPSTVTKRNGYLYFWY